jgi:hypothetical protein
MYQPEKAGTCERRGYGGLACLRQAGLPAVGRRGIVPTQQRDHIISVQLVKYYFKWSVCRGIASVGARLSIRKLPVCPRCPLCVLVYQAVAVPSRCHFTGNIGGSRSCARSKVTRARNFLFVPRTETTR